jgi:nucleotide-binding universal stress UspA family protein
MIRYSRFDRPEVIFSNLPFRKMHRQQETHSVQEHPGRNRWVGPCSQGRRARHPFHQEVGAKITALTVTEPFHVLSLAPSELEYTPIEYKKHTEAQAEKVLGTVSAAAQSAGVVCETLHIEHDQIYQAIIDAASARRCDLIVMASHGRRASRRLSSAAKQSKCSRTRRSQCWCIAEGAPHRSRRGQLDRSARIVVGIDGLDPKTGVTG